MKYIQFDRSTVQGMLKTLEISHSSVFIHTLSSSMQCSVRHEIKELRCCSYLWFCVGL